MKDRSAMLPDEVLLPPLWNEPEVEATRRAIRDLAVLCGLDVRHFRQPGEKTPPDFGARALASTCDILDPLGGVGPEGDGSKRDADLPLRARQDYAHKPGLARYQALNAAFLAHEKTRRIPSPLSGGEASILGSLPVGPYQVTSCLEQGRLILHLGLGYMTVGLYYPAENLLLVLNPFRLEFRKVLHIALSYLLDRPLAYAGWLRRAITTGLRRAYVIGDERPSHFIRQSLAYLDQQEAAVRKFGRRGGLLVAVTDWCAMDPFAVIPSLASLDRLSLRSERLTDTLLQAGLDGHRVYRVNFHHDTGWLRTRLLPGAPSQPAPAAKDRFRVMLSVDAERQRFVNQVEAFRFVLHWLGEACQHSKLILDLVWDGWTVPGEPSARDREVMGRIEDVIARVIEDLPVSLGEQLRIFSLSSLAKVPEIARCDLALTTRGTGALICSGLLRRPTIVYHAAAGAGHNAELDEATVVPVDQRAISEPPADPARPGLCFSIAPWGLEEALRRAVGDRLAIRSECAAPA
jgi:hypothetical protein